MEEAAPVWAEESSVEVGEYPKGWVGPGSTLPFFLSAFPAQPPLLSNAPWLAPAYPGAQYSLLDARLAALESATLKLEEGQRSLLTGVELPRLEMGTWPSPLSEADYTLPAHYPPMGAALGAVPSSVFPSQPLGEAPQLALKDPLLATSGPLRSPWPAPMSHPHSAPLGLQPEPVEVAPTQPPVFDRRLRQHHSRAAPMVEPHTPSSLSEARPAASEMASSRSASSDSNARSLRAGRQLIKQEPSPVKSERQPKQGRETRSRSSLSPTKPRATLNSRRRTSESQTAAADLGRRLSLESHDSGHSASSPYRGVSRHRLTQRWEASLWLSGKQLYLGGFEDETEAARAYDIAALACKGPKVPTNFAQETYAEDMATVSSYSKEEIVAWVRRRSSAFSRGRSRFRGVSGHVGRWEARIGTFAGRKNVSFGIHDTEEAAAHQYDRALIMEKGRAAKTNFPLADYDAEVKAFEEAYLHPGVAAADAAAVVLPLEPASSGSLDADTPERQKGGRPRNTAAAIVYAVDLRHALRRRGEPAFVSPQLSPKGVKGVACK